MHPAYSGVEQRGVSVLRDAFVAAALSGILGFPVLMVLRRLQVLDAPNDRSSHVRPTPRGGGIAPLVGAMVALALSSELAGEVGLGVVVAAGCFGGVGFVEDAFGIRLSARFGLQVVAASLAVPLLLYGLNESGPGELLLAAGAGAWLLSYVNAYNFMDGIDGISVAQAIVAGAAWWLFGVIEHVPPFAAGGAIAAAAAAGFAPFNFPVARMFLGDVGSYFFGALLAAVAVVGVRSGLPPEAVLGPLALYLADTGTTLVRRVVTGERWYQAHREHVYQRLVRLGWSHLRTTLLVSVMMVACAGLGAVSLAGRLGPRLAADVALAALLLGYLGLPRLLQARARATVAPSPGQPGRAPSSQPTP